METKNYNRRHFIQTVGILSVGFSMVGVAACNTDSASSSKKLTFSKYPKLQAGELESTQIDSWLYITDTGRVGVRTGKMELGQGLSTAIAQVAAEELQVGVNLVKVHIAETGYTPNEGYTAGSRSMETSAMSVRAAAATARELLFDLAATHFAVDRSSLSIKDGFIYSGAEAVPVYELLKGKTFSKSVSFEASTYAKTKRKVVGKPILRENIKDIVSANVHFIQDLRFEDIVHARVIHPPVAGAHISSVDTQSIEKLPNLLKFVRLGSFVAVVAKDEYQSIKISKAVAEYIQWTTPESHLPDENQLEAHIKSLPKSSRVDQQSETWSNQLLDAGLTRHQASYFKPYIMHGSTGPSCALARYTDEKLVVWSHTQGVYPLRSALSQLTDMPEDAIHVKGVPAAGCYGHNGADDVAAEASLIAQQFPNHTIRLQWMREDENQWEPYGTAMAMEIDATLDNKGKIHAWEYQLWSDDHGVRPGGDANKLLPAWYLEKDWKLPQGGSRGGATRNSVPYYTIPHMKLTSHMLRGPLRRSSLRGLGANGNVFAIESFMSELADKAGKDPIEFRLEHLSDPRAIACLKGLKEKLQTQPSQNIGVAFARYKNTAAYCAVAVQLKEESSIEQLRVQKLWAVVDAGEVINLDGIKNQIEGGMMQSLSWGLHERVRFDQTRIISEDWKNYPILRFHEAPEAEVHIIDQPQLAPLGAGEAASGPTMAALANAIYRATSKRIRVLPIAAQIT